MATKVKCRSVRENKKPGPKTVKVDGYIRSKLSKLPKCKYMDQSGGNIKKQTFLV